MVRAAARTAPADRAAGADGTVTPSSRVPALDGLRGFALVGMLLWVAAFNGLLHRFADDHDDAVVIDYGGFVDALDDDVNAELLPDGVHPTSEAAHVLWSDFLGPAVVSAFDD